MSASKIVMKIVRISFSVLVVVLVIFVLFKAGSYAYDFGYRVYTEQPVSSGDGKDIVVQIEAGMSGSDIGSMLEEKGLIRDARLFAVQLKLSAYSKKIKPGIYTLNTSMTAKEMMEACHRFRKKIQRVQRDSRGTISNVYQFLRQWKYTAFRGN